MIFSAFTRHIVACPVRGGGSRNNKRDVAVVTIAGSSVQERLYAENVASLPPTIFALAAVASPLVY